MALGGGTLDSHDTNRWFLEGSDSDLGRFQGLDQLIFRLPFREGKTSVEFCSIILSRVDLRYCSP